MTETIAAILDAGIAVMGFGLIPLTATARDGFGDPGGDEETARKTTGDALAREETGCFAVGLEVIPAPGGHQKRAPATRHGG